MDSGTLTTVFFAGGIILMIIETLVPGGVSFFLGLSGIVVGLLRWLGIIVSPVTSITIWLFSSIALIMAIRPFLMKYWGGDSSYKLANEDLEAMDQVVDVIEPINDQDHSGRIHFQGISWQARTLDGEIPAGSKAKIRYRDNVTWVVEAVDEIDG